MTKTETLLQLTHGNVGIFFNFFLFNFFNIRELQYPKKKETDIGYIPNEIAI